MTLTVYVPLLTGMYDGILTLGLAPTHSVQVTIQTYVNWTTSWIPGEVEACTGNCSTEANGGTMTLWTNYVYTLTPVDLASKVFLRQWNATIGTLSSNTSDPTSVLVQTTGVIAMVLEYNNAAGPWAGYVSSPTSSGGAISAVSSVIVLPASTNDVAVAYWVGIGGVGSAALWQAGVVVWGNGTLVPFWEEVGSCAGCGVANYNYNMVIYALDQVEVSVSVVGTTSYFTIVDETQTTTWSGSASFQPASVSADWVVEPKVGTPTAIPIFKAMMINGGEAELQNPFLALELGTDGSTLVPSTLTHGSSGYLQFTLN